MPETGAAIAEWWTAAGEAAATEGASAAAAAGEGAAVAGGALAGEGVLGAEDAAGLETGVTAADAMGGTNLAASAPSSAEGIVPGSGPASTPIAEAQAATPTQTAAKSLIEQGAAGPTPAAAPGDIAEYGAHGPQYMDPGTGSMVTPGSGTGAADALAPKGMLSSAMDWVNAKPVNTLIAGQAVGGVAKGAFEERAANRKLKAEQEAREYPAKLKQGNPSVGGGNVNLNLRPGGRVLTRQDGTKVFVPGTGIISTGMNGVRG